MNALGNWQATLYTASTWVLPVIFAITFHEAAHGFIANRFGDDTALRAGRISFNPLKHVDGFGTIVLPAMLILLRSPFLFGYAKPVPVNFNRLRPLRAGMVLVAAAGPGMNILLAVASSLLLYGVDWMPPTSGRWAADNLVHSIQLNAVLCVFNMLPLPPLDGGRVAVGLLPRALALPLARVEPYGIIILLLFLFILPSIGNQAGVDLNILAHVISGPTAALIGFVLLVTGRVSFADDHALEYHARQDDEPALVLDLDGYEGPIDLLLALAREQKVDLAKLSILALADQYLAFIAAQRRLRLEIAADYLVMAAWLAYLKSRLLLPEPPGEDEGPSAEELAASLGHRLRLLAAMQRAGAALMAGPQLGRDVFARGMPEGLPRVDRPVYELTLYELLSAYGEGHRRSHARVLTIELPTFHSLDEALHHLAQFVGHVPEWRDLLAFLPEELRGAVYRRSALAATFAATLELTRSGRVELRQDRAFGPIYLRSTAPRRGDAG